jgi:hypothetical protein
MVSSFRLLDCSVRLTYLVDITQHTEYAPRRTQQFECYSLGTTLVKRAAIPLRSEQADGNVCFGTSTDLAGFETVHACLTRHHLYVCRYGMRYTALVHCEYPTFLTRSGLSSVYSSASQCRLETMVDFARVSTKLET